MDWLRENVKPLFGLIFLLSGFFSLAVRPEQTRICEDENNVEFVAIYCEHRFLWAKLFFNSDCSLSYKKYGEPAIYSDPEPAQRDGNNYRFFASTLFSFDPVLKRVSDQKISLVRVNFEKYMMEVRGDVNGIFVNCRVNL